MERAKRTRGFTSAELAISLSITSMIGLTIGAASGALSNAYNETQNMAELLQSQRVATNNIEKAVRTAKLITATAGNGMIVWQGDANGNGSIDLNELVMISYDATNHQVVEQSLPNLLPGLNTVLSLNSANSFSGVASAIDSPVRGSYLSSVVLATNVQDFEVRTDVAAPLSTVVLIRISTQEGQESVTVTDSIHLRADLTSAVSFSNGVPILSL